MARDQCYLCHRDLGPDVLVRCREPDCPLNVSRARASAVVLGGLFGLILLVGLVLAAAYWFLRGDRPRDEVAGASSVEDAVQPASASSLGGPSLLPTRGSGGPATGDGAAESPADAGAPQPDGETPDPRAATRVQSFSCEGGLSSSQVAICTHWSLATADYNLSLQYRSALRHSRNPQALRRAHAAWLARLDQLGGDIPSLRKAFDDWGAELGRR